MDFICEAISIVRTFILENEYTNKTKVIPFNICIFNNEVDLFPLLSYALEQLKGAQIRIYDFRNNKYMNI
jgi:hypothetical protein